jgi:hypothetical protein
MTIPWENSSFINSFLEGISPEGICCKFPFSLSRKTIARKKKSVFKICPSLSLIWIKALPELVDNSLVLACKIGFSIEIILVFLIGIEIQLSLIYKELFINPVGSPPAEVICFDPAYADNRIVIV